MIKIHQDHKAAAAAAHRHCIPALLQGPWKCHLKQKMTHSRFCQVFNVYLSHSVNHWKGWIQKDVSVIFFIDTPSWKVDFFIFRQHTSQILVGICVWQPMWLEQTGGE